MNTGDAHIHAHIEPQQVTFSKVLGGVQFKNSQSIHIQIAPILFKKIA